MVMIEKLSFDAIADVPDSVDFIFIDGDHSYQGITRDWELYAGKLIQGGLIALHDTTAPPGQPEKEVLGSVRFFNEVISKDPRFDWLETVHSMNILQRK